MYKVYLIAPKEISIRSKTTEAEKTNYNFVQQAKENPLNAFYIKRIQENIGIGSIAAYLRIHGIEVQTINLAIEDVANNEIVNLIIKENPLIVGLSVLYDLHIFNALQIIFHLRKNGFKNHITLGGTFVSLAFERILKTCLMIDTVIIGDGEKVFYELFMHIRKEVAYNLIHGIAFRNKDGEILYNKPILNTEEINLPNVSRDTLDYLKKNNYKFNTAAIYSSRGCNNKCLYCSAPLLNKLCNKIWRPRNVDSLVKEIEQLAIKYDISYLYFCDDNFCGYGTKGKNHLLEFIAKMKEKELKIGFHAELRVDCKLTREDIFGLKEIGLREALLGIESGSQNCLDRWKKGVKIKDNEDMISQLKQCGVKIAPAFIMVDPYTTPSEFLESIDFIEKNELHLMNDPWYLFNMMIAYPGTELEKKLISDGIILKKEIMSFKLENIKDDKDIKNYCENISIMEYKIIDRSVRKLWNVLTFEVDKIVHYLNIEIPSYLKFCRNNKEMKQNLQCITKISCWRREIGNLLIDFLRCGKKWLLNEKNKQNEDEIRRQLDDIRCKYDIIYLGMRLEQYIDRSKFNK